MNKRTVLGLGLGMGIGLGLPACERAPREMAPSAQKEGGPNAPPTLAVVAVQAQRLATTVRLLGELIAYEQVAVYPRVQGFVDDILVDRGSKVRRGQLLARLSAPELRARRLEANSKVEADRSSFERLRAAADTPGTVARHDLELAEAALKAGQAHAQSLTTLEEYLLLRAPFDGIVTERNVHPGALVGPPAGTDAVPLLRIEQIARLRLTVAVPEAEAGSVAEGVACEFTVRAFPAQRFRAEVRRISHAVSERTRTMAVELDYDNSLERLAPGMFCEVFWPVRRDAPSLFVPATAVARTTEHTYVDRVRDGIIEQVNVEPGIAVEEKMEIFGALQPGDLVLRRGSEELRNGSHIQIKTEVPDSGMVR